MSDNEIYLLIKYIKSVLWRVAKRLSYIQDVRWLKVNFSLQSQQGLVSIVFPSIRISTLSSFLTDTWHNARRIYLEEIIRNILNHYPLTDY